MPNQPGEHRELKVGVTSRKMSPTELRFARVSEDARRSRGREHYRNLSVKEAEGFRDDMADTKRPDRLLVSQVRFPRIDVRAHRVERVDFSEVDLEDVRFKPLPFRKPITIRDCTFRGSLLHGQYDDLVFEDALFDDCAFYQFHVRRSALRRCRFVNCGFSEMSDFRSCGLQSVEIAGRSPDLSFDESALAGFRLVGHIGMGVIGGCQCDGVDLSGCSFRDYAFVLNKGRIDFPVSRDCFVITEESVLATRRVLEPQISPQSLRVLHQAVVQAEYIAVLASELKEAPERDLMLDTLYAHHVDHS